MSTAGVRACQVVFVISVIVDEASQIKEVDTLNAFVRHMAFNHLHKLILFGDHQQLKPTVPSAKVSEFAHSTEMPLMTCFIKAGHFYKMLNEQYRMHFHIAKIVNRIIYDEKIINAFFIIN